MTGIKWRKKVIVMKRRVAIFLLSMIMIAAIGFGAAAQMDTAIEEETEIVLEEGNITVNGNPISEDMTSAVYVGANIVYYEDGHDSSYGEGDSTEEHSEEEANKHTVITITQPGIYRISGTLEYGQIAVDLGSDAEDNPEVVVELILDGVNITSTVAPAVIFYNVWESGSSEEAGAIVTIADDSVNIINGSHVARIYKEGTTKKLHKYDGAFYSKKSMIVGSEESGTGKLIITADNEGLDSEMHLTINGGNIWINSQDDGINANEDGVSVVTINGGYLYINAGNGKEGDGVDSNGYLYINGGILISLANGHTGDGGIDADSDIVINGGTVIALGSRNDATSPNSEQLFMELSYASIKAAGTLISITDSEGNEILTFEPEKDYQSVTFSSPSLVLNEVYYLYSGGVQQQYSGNGFGMGFGMGGMTPPGFADNQMQIPDDLDEWLSTADIPSDIRTWIESVKEMFSGRSDDMGEFRDRPEMTTTDPFQQQMNNPWDRNTEGTTDSGTASPEFIITEDQYSFSNINEYSQISEKTPVVFRVNEDNVIADVEYGSELTIVYSGVTTKDGNPVDIADGDIQFTITDVPSEDYAASCKLSDGPDALADIFPEDTGTYTLTIAVVDSNNEYTGSNQWTFSIK
jgi:hypothetical protein